MTEPKVITAEPPPSHEQRVGGIPWDLRSKMVCRDCEWMASGSDSYIACVALEHATNNPGHRLQFQASANLIERGDLPGDWRGRP